MDKEIEIAAEEFAEAYDCIGDMQLAARDAFTAGAVWHIKQAFRSDKLFLPDDMRMINGKLYRQVTKPTEDAE